MKQLITLCRDSSLLIAELKADFPQYISGDDTEGYNFLATKTNTVRNGLLSLSNVLATQEVEDVMRSMTSLEVLGTFDEIEADVLLLAKFKEVLDFTVSTGVDEDGVEIFPSFRFCVHA